MLLVPSTISRKHRPVMSRDSLLELQFCVRNHVLANHCKLHEELRVHCMKFILNEDLRARLLLISCFRFYSYCCKTSNSAQLQERIPPQSILYFLLRAAYLDLYLCIFFSLGDISKQSKSIFTSSFFVII